MKRKMSRRAGVIFLSLALCLSLMPQTVLAEDIDDWNPPEAPETSGAWTETNENGNPNYDISWYTDRLSKTEFTLSDAADLAGLAVIVNGLYKITGEEDWYEADATLDGVQIEKEKPLRDSFAGKTVKLDQDGKFDLSGKTWTPIGDARVRPFQGTFVGSNCEIKGLTISNSGPCAGLFGHVDGGTIQNVTLADVDIRVSTKTNYTAIGTVAACLYSTGEKRQRSPAAVRPAVLLQSTPQG